MLVTSPHHRAGPRIENNLAIFARSFLGPGLPRSKALGQVLQLTADFCPILPAGFVGRGRSRWHPQCLRQTLDYAVRTPGPEIVRINYLRSIHALGAELSLFGFTGFHHVAPEGASARDDLGPVHQVDEPLPACLVTVYGAWAATRANSLPVPVGASNASRRPPYASPQGISSAICAIIAESLSGKWRSRFGEGRLLICRKRLRLSVSTRHHGCASKQRWHYNARVARTDRDCGGADYLAQDEVSSARRRF